MERPQFTDKWWNSQSMHVKTINLKCVQYFPEICRKDLKCCHLAYVIHILVLLVCTLTDKFKKNYLWTNKFLRFLIWNKQAVMKVHVCYPAGEVHVAYLTTVLLLLVFFPHRLWKNYLLLEYWKKYLGRLLKQCFSQVASDMDVNGKNYSF